jgi:hypothetical protein
MRRAYVLGLLLISVLFFQCQKEVGFFGTPDNPAELPAPDPIKSVLQGNVLNETGQPAAGVLVQVGNKTATTDQKGYFRITEAALDKKASVVTAIKPGYFKAYRTFSASSGTNQVVIKLIKKVLTGSVSAASGGAVTLSNGSKIALPASGIVTASNNNAYGGTVNVYATYIDPTSSDINQTVPGSFLANNKDGKRVLLASYGMMAVELESSTGEKLQIKSGATATLTTAIPSAVQGSAPATIALWSMDETTGVWKEEGTATKNGSVYVGEVRHFSFWNCDVAQSTVTLSLTVKNGENNPLVNVAVRIKRTTESGVSFGYGYTDSLGQVRGYVPSNEPLVLEVLDECGEAFYSKNISALAQSTDLGVVTVSNTGSSIVTMKGKLVNCANAAVTNGFAIITYGNKVRYASVNATGDFQTTFTRCSSSPSTADIVGVDNASQQQGNATSVTVAVPQTNAGSVSACGVSSEQFINYTLDGTTYSMTSNSAGYLFGGYTDSVQVGIMGSTFLKVYQQNSSTDRINFGFRHQNPVTGTYQLSRLTVQDYSTDGGPIGITLLSPSNVVITTFPQGFGQFYEGSISSTFRDSLNISHSLTGTFKLLRQ